MLKAYGELLLLFLVRVSEWGGEASDGLSGAAAAAAAAAAAHLLRRAMGAPITALLEGTLPARLSEAEAVDGLAAAAEALAASARCGAAVAPFWREIAASCGEACTGGGPVGRPVGEVVGSAGVFLAAVVGRLERRGESAAAGTQVRDAAENKTARGCDRKLNILPDDVYTTTAHRSSHLIVSSPAAPLLLAVAKMPAFSPFCSCSLLPSSTPRHELWGLL
jgi:hypothetical protein